MSGSVSGSVSGSPSGSSQNVSSSIGLLIKALTTSYCLVSRSKAVVRAIRLRKVLAANVAA